MRLYGITGWEHAGKAWLVERLVSEISDRGFTVSTLKQAPADFDVDQPGKDSHRHRAAGATEVVVSSRMRSAMMSEIRGGTAPKLADLIARLRPVDLLLIEGWQHEDHPRLEAWGAWADHPPAAPQDPRVRAVASDEMLALDRPVFDLNDTAAIADFILAETGLATPPAQVQPLAPPPLKNDCFALPPGVEWMPVDEALDRLKGSLTTVVGRETISLDAALGRVLAAPVTAGRANPPGANSAVDGYGFAHAATGDGPQELPLVAGRAAAGAPYRGTVPEGSAVRILTGALLPEGVDTVVLEEDTTTDGARLAFRGPVKRGANTRRAGEDVDAGQEILPAGRRLTPGDIALVAATGGAALDVFQRLRVGVLSTGDEIVPAGQPAPVDRTYDANRPMLLAMLKGFGFDAIDLGHVADERSALRDRFDEAAGSVDAILTSGGASAGDEDHVSALLREEAQLTAWRIAVKPGRPLALAQWKGMPVFGLPGNPVAAFVCAAIFARPALGLMAGAGWVTPDAFTVPAAFTKSKKPGRTEFLRARLDARGHAEVFVSEGSGRISGLSWATGLVRLPEGAAEIAPGNPVSFLPFAS